MRPPPVAQSAAFTIDASAIAAIFRLTAARAKWQQCGSRAALQCHLVLALCIVGVLFAQSSAYERALGLRLVALSCCSRGLLVAFGKRLPPVAERCMLWLEAAWLSLIVFVTSGAGSPFFLLYMFSLTHAAARLGKRHTLWLAAGAASMLAIACAAEHKHVDLLRIVAQVCCVIAAGWGIASVGESNRRHLQRMVLLHDINRIANPRFGIDRTVADIMARCRAHFGASVCLLVARRARSNRFDLRVDNGGATATRQRLSSDTVLARLDNDTPLLLKRPRQWLGGLAGGIRLVQHRGHGDWLPSECAAAGDVANLCEAGSLISVPVSFLGGSARIILCTKAGSTGFSKEDALFLEQVVTQVQPAIETVYLLDRMASMAQLHERRAMAHDVHDSAIQPYIGLNAALAALRSKAGRDNPLRNDIEDLAAMSAQVIADLRQFADELARGRGRHGASIDAALRRQLLRAKQWYGLDITLELRNATLMGDRLAAAVLQLTSEGISNICKHTAARHASVRIASHAGMVCLDIENESAAPVRAFVPGSISARSLALGGHATVEQGRGLTIVHIVIPT